MDSPFSATWDQYPLELIKAQIMKNNIHPEFAYQARELAIQIEDTLGDPPDQKNYAKVVKSLQNEYAKGNGIDDVNLLSFALVDFLKFTDPAALLAQSAQYDAGNAESIAEMVSCLSGEATAALQAVLASDPELARKAVITAFLFKNNHRWAQEDQSLESLQREEDGEDDDEEEYPESGYEIDQLFDARGDEND